MKKLKRGKPTKSDREKAFNRIDWTQINLNYPMVPCFHLELGGRFCLRGEGWDGHKGRIGHKFVSIHAAYLEALADQREEDAKIALEIYSNPARFSQGARLMGEQIAAAIRRGKP